MADDQGRKRSASIEVPLSNRSVSNVEPATLDAGLPPTQVGDIGFGEPLKLAYLDAQRIADSRLGTAEVLGVASAMEALRAGEISDERVRAQVDLFVNRLSALEKKFTDLKTAPTTFPGYGDWLSGIQKLRHAPTAARDLLAILDGERHRRLLAELRVSAGVYLQDRVLEWSEHTKMLWQAEQLGLGPEDVEAVYREFPPFTREPEPARAAATGAISPVVEAVAPKARPSVPGEEIAQAIERAVGLFGTRSQSREGTVLVRRAVLFHAGVEYVVEERIHKSYEAAKNRRRCVASEGGAVRFDWQIATDAGTPGRMMVFNPGPWVEEIGRMISGT